jgi:hypothetical protein
MYISLYCVLLLFLGSYTVAHGVSTQGQHMVSIPSLTQASNGNHPETLSNLDVILRQGREMLSQRVCGQPAIDGCAAGSNLKLTCMFTVEPKLINSATTLEHVQCSSVYFMEPGMRRYSHVNASCLEQSPTNLWHKAYLASGGRNDDLIAHIDERSDYDGLAVAWGIGNKEGTIL